MNAHIFDGLNPEFVSVVTTLSAKPEATPFATIRSMCIDAEYRHNTSVLPTLLQQSAITNSTSQALSSINIAAHNSLTSKSANSSTSTGNHWRPSFPSNNNWRGNNRAGKPWRGARYCGGRGGRSYFRPP